MPEYSVLQTVFVRLVILFCSEVVSFLVLWWVCWTMMGKHSAVKYCSGYGISSCLTFHSDHSFFIAKVVCGVQNVVYHPWSSPFAGRNVLYTQYLK